jgi:small conductance mechanosensitive channel
MNPESLVNEASQFDSTYLIPFGWRILGAIGVWIVGSWIVKFVAAAFGRMLVARKVDPTLGRYLEASASVLMKILVLIAAFGVLGIETTSFAALIAAVGIAIGAAWAGLLANFAAGIFLMTLRPFKVGDMITVAGVTGDVKEIGLFADTIHNYTTNPYRRVDLKAQIAHSVDPRDAIKRLAERVARIPNVIAQPAPSLQILEFNPMGAVIAVRPYCHNSHYWQVYFDTNRAISDVCGEAGYAVPETRYALRQLQ